jgi:hypothetical protein
MPEDNNKKIETSRRRFLKTAAKIAVYVPPAMLALSQPSHATFSQSSGVTHHGGQYSWNQYYGGGSFWSAWRNWFRR